MVMESPDVPLINSILDMPDKYISNIIGAKLKDIKFKIDSDNLVNMFVEMDGGGFFWIKTNICGNEPILMGGGQLPK